MSTLETRVRETPEASPPVGWWGMIGLIATEAALFGILLASYWYLRFQAGPEWPPEGIPEPKLVKPGWMTGLLIASSVPMVLATLAARRASRAGVGVWLAAAFVLGAAFLGLQADAIEKSVKDFTPQDHAYGAIFYTIVVGHAAHVFGGLALNVWSGIVAWGGMFGRKSRVAVGTSALYWHFVNALAVAVYVSVYVLPRL